MPNAQRTTRVYVPGGGIQIRENGELGPVYIGWCDVPDSVLYTLQLMPGYAATDERGVPLANSLAAASVGDRGLATHSSMPAPDASYARGEEFNTDVATADPRGLLSQEAIDAAQSGERTGGESLLEQVSEYEEGKEPRSPVKGQRELSFVQRRQIRDEVRSLQLRHEHAIETGEAEKGTRPVLVSKENEAVADEFDDEFGSGDSGSIQKAIKEHQSASDGAGVSGVAGQKVNGGTRARKSAARKSRKGAGARKRSAARKRGSRSRKSESEAAEE